MTVPAIRFFAVAAGLWLATAACGDGPGTELIPMADYESVADRLREWDLDINELGDVSVPCFTVTPKVALVGGGTLEVFEYPTAASAETAIGRIAPAYYRASMEKVEEISPDDIFSPRFYKDDRLLAIYIGTNPQVVQALESALGPPFADGSSDISCRS